jgi:hypothetical protein
MCNNQPMPQDYEYIDDYLDARDFPLVGYGVMYQLDDDDLYEVTKQLNRLIKNNAGYPKYNKVSWL